MADHDATWWGPPLDPAIAAELCNPDERDLASAFGAVARRVPDRVALSDGALTLTYAELDAWSAALAATLPDDPVIAVRLGHDAHTVVAMVAIARAGAAHLVLDGRASDGQVAAVLDRHRIRAVVDFTTVETARRSAVATSAAPVDPWRPVSVSTTSGSTGHPKAVVHSHRNVVTNAWRFARATGMTPDDRVLSALPFPFVGSTTPTFAPLLAGATALVHDLAAGPVTDLLSRARAEGATFVFLTAGLIAGITDITHRRVEPAPSVRWVVTGGDRLTVAHLRTLHRWFPAARVLHRYNTSETLWVTGLTVDPGTLPATLPDSAEVPIGWPVPWLEVEPAPDAGAESGGELVVRGDHLALGYLDDPESTAARFAGEGVTRTYRTGDLARRGDDGRFEFVERVDGSVKVHDVLVDRARVEATVMALAGVRRAAVVDWTNARGLRRLAAFVVADPSTGDGATLDAASVREALAAELLPAEVPTVVEFVDQLPLNAMGKLDVLALRAQAQTLAVQRPKHESGRTRDEQTIAAAFAAILELDRVGRDDDFFALDADSLDTVELLEFLRDELDATVELETLFAYPTPRALAAHLRDDRPGRLRRGDSHLVALTRAPADDVVVVMFGGAGGVLLGGLGRLARRLEGYSCDAVVPRAFDYRGRADHTVPALARSAVRDITAAFADRRVVLLGFSAGGIVAFETACQLTAAGAPPLHLFLVDGYAKTAAERRRRRLPAVVTAGFAAGRRTGGVRGVAKGLRGAAGAARRHLGERATAASAGWVHRTGKAQQEAFAALTTVALRRYRARPYDGAVTVIASTGDRELYTLEGDDLGWSDLVRGPLEVLQTPGKHLQQLDRPSVDFVGALVARELNRRTTPPG